MQFTGKGVGVPDLFEIAGWQGAQKKGPCNEHGPQETREASIFWSG